MANSELDYWKNVKINSSLLALSIYQNSTSVNEIKDVQS